jgi:hypothetical protein
MDMMAEALRRQPQAGRLLMSGSPRPEFGPDDQDIEFVAKPFSGKDLDGLIDILV